MEKARAEYEEKMRARSKGNDKLYDQLIVGVKSTIDVKLLDALCTLRWGINKENVTDERIMTEIDAIVQSVKNDTIPDINRLFKKELRMDMRETDVSERVLQYFMLCDALIEENGLKSCFDTENDQKEKRKLLIKSLTPEDLQTDVKNPIRFPAAHSHRQNMHDLVLEKALEQDRDFRCHKRAKYDEPFDRTEKPDKLHNRRGQLARRGKLRPGHNGLKDTMKGFADRVVDSVTEAKPAAESTRSSAPRDGCLGCQGPHYVSKCPVATEEEKRELLKKFHVKKSLITLNGVLELQYWADTGSDWSLLSRGKLKELARLDTSVTPVKLGTPVVGMAVGGHAVQAFESVQVKIRLLTAAGPVEPAKSVTCLIIEQDDDEFIVGSGVLRSLGIDAERQLEQLASNQSQVDDDPFERDEEGPTRGQSGSSSITEGIAAMIAAAIV
ncbi:hypothetical protein PI124_g14677 [Phytophthora idaei]|nr:hypothetical protein PI124_g14677 [Phytophthora idaei]